MTETEQRLARAEQRLDSLESRLARAEKVYLEFLRGAGRKICKLLGVSLPEVPR